jgi:hypothetical protein
MEIIQNIKKDDRLPQGYAVLGKIKEFPEGGTRIEGVLIKFGDEEERSE